MFDFSKIEHDDNAVIHCSTKELAEEFLKHLKEYYPSRKFFGGATHWDFYEEDTCYWPNFGGIEVLQYGSLQCALEDHYHVYEVEELMVAELPIESSDIDMKCLFGME